MALCSEVFGDHSLLVDGSTEAGDGGGGYSNSTGVIINGGCQTEVRGGLKVSISILLAENCDVVRKNSNNY